MFLYLTHRVFDYKVPLYEQESATLRVEKWHLSFINISESLPFHHKLHRYPTVLFPMMYEGHA
jgi:hypothetical protein